MFIAHADVRMGSTSLCRIKWCIFVLFCSHFALTRVYKYVQAPADGGKKRTESTSSQISFISYGHNDEIQITVD